MPEALVRRSDLTAFWLERANEFPSGSFILCLDGEVGAGKTESIKTLQSILGIEDVASPSFAIFHQYQSKAGKNIFHADLYRLKDEEDLDSTGFWDLFSGTNWIFVEWASYLSEEAWPMGWPRLNVWIEKVPGDPLTRKIEWNWTEAN